MKLWGNFGGEPFLTNPHLGILGNPKTAASPCVHCGRWTTQKVSGSLVCKGCYQKKGRKNMAKRHGAAHMAWVRSFKKRNPGRRRRGVRRVARRTARRNPYPMAGLVVNRRRRRRGGYSRNPKIFGFQLPSVMDAVYGGIGFIAVPMIEGVLSSFAPSITASALGRWAVRVGSVAAETYLAKMILGNRAATTVAIGGGSYVLVSALKEFAPGMIPGLSAYRTGSSRSHPTLEAYAAGGRNRVTLGAPQFGARNSAAFAGRGAANVVAARFRRFQ